MVLSADPSLAAKLAARDAADAARDLAVVRRGRIAADGQIGESFTNETTIQTFHSFVHEADTLLDGDLLRWHFLSEIVAIAVGTYTAKLFVNGVEALDLTGAPAVSTIGFDFLQPSVLLISPTNVRFFDDFNGLDISGVNPAEPITIEFRCNFNTANVGNTHRKLHGYIGFS